MPLKDAWMHPSQVLHRPHRTIVWAISSKCKFYRSHFHRCEEKEKKEKNNTNQHIPMNRNEHPNHHHYKPLIIRGWGCKKEKREDCGLGGQKRETRIMEQISRPPLLTKGHKLKKWKWKVKLSTKKVSEVRRGKGTETCIREKNIRERKGVVSGKFFKPSFSLFRSKASSFQVPVFSCSTKACLLSHRRSSPEKRERDTQWSLRRRAIWRGRAKSKGVQWCVKIRYLSITVCGYPVSDCCRTASCTTRSNCGYLDESVSVLLNVNGLPTFV